MVALFCQILFYVVWSSSVDVSPTDWDAEQPDFLWSQYLSDLHWALDGQDYYAAKQALKHLEDLNPNRFSSDQLGATRAWIAMQEGNWGTAAHEFGLALKHNRRPRLVLERALCLKKLGRYEEALDDLDAVRKAVKDRRLRWEWYFLKAECARLAGHSRSAISAYQKLRYRPVPSSYRIQAYRYLAELHYMRGNISRGRASARLVQRRWPTSDAALDCIDLQERFESSGYLRLSEVVSRFAWVCYRNREYDRSDGYYDQILKRGGRGNTQARALYFKTITHIKKEDPINAVTALERAYPILIKSKYEGPAAFQMSRVLFMLGRDQEVVEFVDRYWQDGRDAKWRQECIKLKILSLRRMNRHEEFARLGTYLENVGARHWLLRFFFRNGVVWALEQDNPDQALFYLTKYRSFGLDKSSSLEMLLWEGLILWQQKRKEEAIDAWLKLLLKDPNHYFSLVVRRMIRDLTYAQELGRRIQADHPGEPADMAADDLKKLYFLLEEGHRKNEVRRLLVGHLPQIEAVSELPIDPRADASYWASIGRFDLAGEVLNPAQTSLSKRAYHFLKAKWYRIGKRPHSSIYHAEVLAKTMPSWAPIELLDSELQQLLFPVVFPKVLQAKAESNQVDVFLLLALIREESRFDVQAKSVASARGLMQFIPSTAKKVATRINGDDEFELGALYEPETSISLGAFYIDSLLDSFGGVSLFSIAAYNAGQDAVQRWRSMSERFDPLRFIWDITYEETRRYCQKVLQSYYQYRRIYGHEHAGSVILTPPILADGS